MSVKYKRLLNRTHHKHEPQSSLAQLCIEMLVQATRNTNFRKLYFNGHPRYTITNIYKHTLFLYFSDFDFDFEKKKKLNNQTKTDKQHENMKERCICMKA